MRRLFPICLFLLPVIGLAQNPNTDFKYGVKISNLSSFSVPNVRDTNGNRLGGLSFSVFRPVVGFMIRTKKGNFTELNLSSLTLNFARQVPSNFSSSTHNTYNFRLGVRVGRFLTFFKEAQRHWVPMLGFELMPYVNARAGLLSSAVEKTYQRQSLGVEAFVSPRIAWFPTKRFFMDATCNLSLIDLSVHHQHTNNPSSATPNSSYFGTFGQALKMNYGIQIGLGLKL